MARERGAYVVFGGIHATLYSEEAVRLGGAHARARQTARCIRVHLASGWPCQSLFRELVLALNTG